MKTNKYIHLLSTALLALTFAACNPTSGTESKEVGEVGDEKPSDNYKFETPTNFSVTATDGGVILYFDPNPKADLFMIYFDNEPDELNGFPGAVGSPVSTNANSITLKGGAFEEGTTYYFAVSAALNDGTETEKTSIESITIEDLPGQSYTYDVELNTCINESTRFIFEDGLFKLGNRSGGLPGEDNSCEFQNSHGDDSRGTWLKLTRVSGGNSYTFPADGTNNPHNFNNGSIDISPNDAHPIFAQMVTTEDIQITAFDTISDEKCPGNLFGGKRYEVVQDGTNRILFDLRSCGDNKWERFYFEDAVKFRITFQSDYNSGD